MNFALWIKKFFKNIFLYQCLIIFSVLRLSNAFRFYKDFIQHLDNMLDSFGLNKSLAFWKHKENHILEWIYKGYLISLIVCAALAILSCPFFQFLSGVASILTGFIYYNPILAFRNRKPQTAQEYFPSMEFIIYVTLGLGMIAQVFNAETPEQKKDDKQIEIEMKQTTDKSNTSTPAGKKKQKKE